MAKNAQQIKALINEIFLFGDGSFDAFELDDIIELLMAADNAYHNAQPLIDDQQYDALRQYAEQVDPNHVYFLGVGSQVRGGKVKLPHPMGSLTQVYDGDFAKWSAQHRLTNEDLLVTEKLDGYSTQIIYDATGKLQIAYSRGDGIEGADITRHVSKFVKLPRRLPEAVNLKQHGLISLNPFEVRAEIIFKKADWEIIKDKIKRSGGGYYKNARNCISGLMNASENDPLVYNYISVVAYEVLGANGERLDKTEQLLVLEALGFETPVSVKVKGNVDDAVLTTILNDMRTNSKYEIDGIVIDVNSHEKRKKMNPTRDTLNPEFARKFKIADASNLAIATVVDVEWNISKNGYLKPRVKIEPVELVGVTVQHATGFNAKFIVDNKIGPGAKIRITRSGDVIPFIVGVVSATEAKLPDEDVEWNATGVDLVLTDMNNDVVKLEQLIDFAAKVGIEHIGEGNMKSIFEAGFTTPTEFINMTPNEIGLAIGSHAIAKKIVKSRAEKINNQPWWQIAGAHPCFGRGIGQRKMKKLYEAFEGDISKLKDVNAIAGVEGFEAKTAKKIVSGYPTFLEFVNATNIKFAAYEAPKGGDLAGQSFLFTGFRDKSLEKRIEDKGGKISSAVSSKLTYLVAADPSETSGKLTKARQLGTKIITREALETLLGD